MDDREPLACWADATCLVCPAQQLGPGRFNVVDGPASRSRLDPDRGYRIDVETGTAVCVHPFRVGLAPGAYTSSATFPIGGPALLAPSQGQLELPDHFEDLEAWLIAVLRGVDPASMAAALNEAESLAGERFRREDVLEALRRVLACGLSD